MTSRTLPGPMVAAFLCVVGTMGKNYYTFVGGGKQWGLLRFAVVGSCLCYSIVAGVWQDGGFQKQ